MAQIYTSTQANTISNYLYRIYVAGIEMAPIPAEDLTFAFTPNKEMVGSAMTGETPIASINKGTAEAKLSFTVNGLNKNQIVTAFTGMIAEGTTPTAESTPYTGTLLGQGLPQRDVPFAVVAVLYYTDETGTPKAPNASVTTLPMNILMPKAVLTGGGEFVFNPAAPASYSLEFSGLADVVNDARQWIMDDGISSSGVYVA